MTKKEYIKKYNIKPDKIINLNKNCITKCIDYRNFAHPYHHDTSKYQSLSFFIAFTQFERNGLYGYISKLMTYNEVKVADNEITKDFLRPGRKAWNSATVIGIDETGQYFAARMH